MLLLFLFVCLGFVSEAAKLGMQGLPVCRSFTLEELEEATNNFDNSAFLGEGSCGKVPSKTSIRYTYIYDMINLPVVISALSSLPLITTIEDL